MAAGNGHAGLPADWQGLHVVKARESMPTHFELATGTLYVRVRGQFDLKDTIVALEVPKLLSWAADVTKGAVVPMLIASLNEANGVVAPAADQPGPGPRRVD